MKNLSKIQNQIEDVINIIKACLEQKRFRIALNKEDYIKIIDEHDNSKTDINTVVVKLFEET